MWLKFVGSRDKYRSVNCGCGKQVYAPCKTSHSNKSSWQWIIVGTNSTKSWSGWHMPTTKMKVQPLMPEYAGMACNMAGGSNGAFGCGLWCGMQVVWVEREKFWKSWERGKLMCVVWRRWDGENRILGFFRWSEYLNCSVLKMQMELMMWESWRRSCIGSWK